MTQADFSLLGHFDNFSCWQFGEESSAHKEVLKVMMEEIEFLTSEVRQRALTESPCGAQEDREEGHIQVSVFGGYTDQRGDAAKNSMSLLSALQDSERTVEVS